MTDDLLPRGTSDQGQQHTVKRGKMVNVRSVMSMAWNNRRKKIRFTWPHAMMLGIEEGERRAYIPPPAAASPAEEIPGTGTPE